MRFAVLATLLASSACLTAVDEQRDGGKDAGATPVPDSGAVQDGGRDRDAGRDRDGGPDQDAGTDGGVDALAALDSFCLNRMTSLCEHESRCGTFSSFAECMSIVTQAWLCPMYRPGVKDGRIAFDADAAMEYERQLRTMCAVPNWDLFAGLVPIGGACFGTQECVSTARCDITLPTCPGLCVAKKQIGAVALSVDDCADGLAGFFTVLDGGGTSLVCEPVATLGQRCTGPGTCAHGLFCNAAGACEALRGPYQPCGASDGGQTDERWCRDYLECQTVDAGPLVCLPLGGLGAPCGICQLGLRCADGTCGPRGIEGQSCNASYECVEGLFCRPNSGVWGPGLCHVTLAVGDPCSLPYECGRGVCEYAPQGNTCVASDGGWHQGFTVCEDPTP